MMSEAIADKKWKVSYRDNFIQSIFCVFIIVNIIIAVAIKTKKLLAIGINSDSLYLLMVYKSIFESNYGISEFVLSPSPCFFPDMLMYFPILGLSPSYSIALFIYGLAYIFTMIILLTWIGYYFNSKIFKNFLLSACTILIFLLVIHRPHSTKIDEFIFIPGRHAGTILSGLLWIGTILHTWKHQWRYPYLFFLFMISFICILSDISIIVQFLIPVCGAIFIAWYFEWIKLRIGFIISSLILISSILVKFFIDVLNEFDLFFIPSLSSKFKIFDDGLLTIIYNFFQNIYNYIVFINPWFLLIWLLWIGMAIIQLWLFFSKKSKFNRLKNIQEPFRRYYIFLWLVVWLSIFITIIVPIITGFWTGLSEIRYIIPVFLLPFAGFAWSAMAWERLIPKKIKIVAGVILILTSSLVIWPGFIKSNADDWEWPYPERVKWVDSIIGKYNLHNGIADYWNANYLTQLSRKDRRINQVLGNLWPYFWINNIHWYVDYHSKGPSPFLHYDFIVTDRLNKEIIHERFGEPAHVESYMNSEIYVYNRPEDVAFRNYLHAYFMDYEYTREENRSYNFINLNIHKPSGVPKNVPGVIHQPPGKQILIQYDPPTVGDVMELSLAGTSPITFRFLNHKNKVYETEINVSPAKADLLSTHYFRFPEALAHYPIYAIEVTSHNEGEGYSLGHLLIYNDTL